MKKQKKKVVKRNKGKKFKFNDKIEKKESIGSVFAQMAGQRQESKKKAEQRRERLIQEYKNQLNQNEFTDLRKAKHNPQNLRLKRDIKKFSKSMKKSKFLLSDSQDGEFENLRRTDEFEEEDGNEEEPRQTVHFIDETENGQGGQEPKKKKSRKERLQQIIAKSKYEKNQRALIKEEELENQEKLNKEFAQVAMLLKKRTKVRQLQDDSDQEEGRLNSAYDMLQLNLQSHTKQKAQKAIVEKKENKREKKSDEGKFSVLREIESEDEKDRNLTKSERIKQSSMKELERESKRKNFASVLQNYLNEAESEPQNSQEEGSVSYEDESSEQD